MAQSFIGSRISLTSISDIRYRGTLHGIDHVNATIQLRNVMSMGTEARRPPHEYIPPSDTPYEYIVFRAKEVKDLALDTVTAVNVHNDPGILHASQPYTPQPPQAGFPTPDPAAINAQQPAPTPPAPSTQKSNGAAPGRQQNQGGGRGGGQQGGGKSPASGQNPRNQNRNNGTPGSNRNGSASASKSLENVERALGDLRVSSTSRGGNSRGGGQNNSEIRAGELRLPTGDFDFQQSNARFDKAAVARSQQQPSDADEKTNPSDSEGDEPPKVDQKDKERESDKYYNPTKSFFDDISSDSKGSAARGGRGGAPGGRGGGRGYGRSRREEEREKNVATFGEAGDVRGYSRWGGRRRGGGGRGGNSGAAGTSGGTKNNG